MPYIYYFMFVLANVYFQQLLKVNSRKGGPFWLKKEPIKSILEKAGLHNTLTNCNDEKARYLLKNWLKILWV